jgi:hypothetical protein
MRWQALLLLVLFSFASLGSGSFSCSTHDDDDDDDDDDFHVLDAREATAPTPLNGEERAEWATARERARGEGFLVGHS